MHHKCSADFMLQLLHFCHQAKRKHLCFSPFPPQLKPNSFSPASAFSLLLLVSVYFGSRDFLTLWLMAWNHLCCDWIEPNIIISTDPKKPWKCLERKHELGSGREKKWYCGTRPDTVGQVHGARQVDALIYLLTTSEHFPAVRLSCLSETCLPSQLRFYSSDFKTTVLVRRSHPLKLSCLSCTQLLTQPCANNPFPIWEKSF